MGVKQMSKPQQERFEKAMVEQGVKVRRTADGFWLTLPNKDHVAVHFTSSDVNAQRTIMRKLRRAGVVHPDDTRGATLPAYITEGTINPKTRKALIDWYIKAGFPKEVLSQDVRAALWPSDPGRSNRALYHTGFRPEERKQGKQKRVWIPPQELLDMAPKPTEEVLKDTATRPLARPAPGTIGERIAEQLKDKERAKQTANLNVPKPPVPVEAVVVPSPAHKENIQKQGGIVPKAIPKPKRQYTEIERALAAQGKTLDDLDNKVVEAATSGTPGELVDAQAEQISALKKHSDELDNAVVQKSTTDLVNANLTLLGERDAARRNAKAAIDECERLRGEVEQALRMAGEAEERATKAEDLLANVKIPNAVDGDETWTIPMKDFLGYSYPTVKDKFDMLKTVGLDYELRVWRRK